MRINFSLSEIIERRDQLFPQFSFAVCEATLFVPYWIYGGFAAIMGASIVAAIALGDFWEAFSMAGLFGSWTALWAFSYRHKIVTEYNERKRAMAAESVKRSMSDSQEGSH